MHSLYKKIVKNFTEFSESEEENSSYKDPLERKQPDNIKELQGILSKYFSTKINTEVKQTLANKYMKDLAVNNLIKIKWKQCGLCC